MRHTTLGVLALAVALTACAEPGTGPTSQTVGTNEDGRPSSPALLAGGASPVIVTAAPIGPFPGSGSGISGEAILTRSTAGLWVDQDIEGLTPGYAYSVWWVIFDNPQGCVASTCAPSDLAIPEAHGSLVNGGGFVAAGTTQSYSSHLARHDVDGAHVAVGDPSGVDNTYRAQVHVALRSHGVAEANPADRAVQTSQFNGFCNLPPDPPGVCQNVSVAVFITPDAPGQGS